MVTSTLVRTVEHTMNVQIFGTKKSFDTKKA